MHNEKIKKQSQIIVNTKEKQKKYQKVSKYINKKISSHCAQLKYSVYWLLDSK